MHQSALKYGELFFKQYLEIKCGSRLTIVDVGSQDVNGSLKQFAPADATYVGVDFVEGKGVDIVITDPYHLPFETESVDAVVCSSVFEHSEFFWLLFQECLRITKPTGLVYINAPSNGMVHRYPIDGWRFYPDAGHSLVNWSKRFGENPLLLESFIAPKLGAIDGEGMWNDFVGVFLKNEVHATKYVSRIVDSERHATSVFAYGRNLSEINNAYSPDTKLLVSQQIEINNLTDNLASKQTEAEQLANKLASKQTEAEQLADKLASKQTEAEQLADNLASKQAEVQGLTHTISAIRDSSSWRYTAGLRAIGSIVRKINGIYHFTSQAASVHGGYWGLMQKVIAICRRDGLNSVLQRITLKSPKHIISTESGMAVDRNDYQAWIRLYDRLDEQTIFKIRSEIINFKKTPKISVVMPVYNSPLKFLEEAIESVRSQIYEHWELCIADDASTDASIRTLLESYASRESRIKVTFREKNGHISAASNSALALATGEFVALLDNDDILPPHALFQIAKTINENPNAALIYSDEDKINEAGLRYDPYFKCGFNYELFLAQNMICHLGVYRHDILKEIGAFREGFEGAQDYDLALRFIEKIQYSKVIHIPKVLYHWRAIPGSTALSSGEKSYAAVAARKAIAEHLVRMDKKAEVFPAPEIPSLNRVRYSLPDILPLVSIIIPTKDKADILSVCLDSLFNKTKYPNFEVIIVDNGSVEEETRQLLSIQPPERVRVLRDDSPFNYSRLNNLAVLKAKGEFICLMNNDIEIITPDWLEEMLSFAMQSDVGCVGARLWYPNGRLQHGGVVLGIGGVAGHSHKHLAKTSAGYFGRAVLHQSMSAVTAACLLVKRGIYDQVGGLDEGLAVAFNDVDFCLKVRESGYRNVWTPYAEMTHHESVSRGHEDTPEKIIRFNRESRKMVERWGNALASDPAYSQNLTLTYEDFSYSWNEKKEAV